MLCCQQDPAGVMQANVLEGSEAAVSEADDGTKDSEDGEDLFDAALESSLAPTSAAGPKV